jgi:hypothetical protein
VGTSQVQPSRRDRRFADPGWAGNPLLRHAMQAYLAAAESAEGVVADAGLDGADSERVGLVLTNLIDALAPSNNPLLNPAAPKAAIDTDGGSALAGLQHRERADRAQGPAPAASSPRWWPPTWLEAHSTCMTRTRLRIRGIRSAAPAP